MNAQLIFEAYGAALPHALRANVYQALNEDIGAGDLTARLVPGDTRGEARLLCRDAAIICGQPWFNACMQAIDAHLEIDWQVAEGARVEPDTVVCIIRGQLRAILTAERCALNFLQLLSGVATKTNTYVEVLRPYITKVHDTRKTLPGLRLAQKYAVRIGGGENQRLALYDGVLIKENHIAAAGGIAQVLQQALATNPAELVQIEVENNTQLELALQCGARSILLDNYSLDEIKSAVALAGQQAILEVSGGITLEALPILAQTGVHRVSVGTLTKDIHAIDFSLRFF